MAAATVPPHEAEEAERLKNEANKLFQSTDGCGSRLLCRPVGDVLTRAQSLVRPRPARRLQV